MEQEEYEAMQKLALEQLRAGKSLTGKGGAFAPLLKQFLESALESEMESHLSEQESESGNKRNGKGRKTMKSLDGEIDIVNPKPRAWNEKFRFWAVHPFDCQHILILTNQILAWGKCSILPGKRWIVKAGFFFAASRNSKIDGRQPKIALESWIWLGIYAVPLLFKPCENQV